LLEQVKCDVAVQNLTRKAESRIMTESKRREFDNYLKHGVFCVMCEGLVKRRLDDDRH